MSVSSTSNPFWFDRRVLVGGGCGFLGSYLVTELVWSGARVTVVDNLYNGEIANLAAVASDIAIEVADLRDPSACDRVMRGLDGEDPLVAWGSWRQRRNLLHALDAARLILRVVERSTDAEPVNLGYDNDVSVADLLEMICEETGRRPYIVFDPSKPEGAARKSADATRLRALVDGYAPQISLREGLRDMVAWYERSFGKAAGVTAASIASAGPYQLLG